MNRIVAILNLTSVNLENKKFTSLELSLVLLSYININLFWNQPNKYKYGARGTAPVSE